MLSRHDCRDCRFSVCARSSAAATAQRHERTIFASSGSYLSGTTGKMRAMTAPPDSSPPPIRWVSELQHFATLVQPLGVQWMLVGSSATAVRGVPLAPGDLDVLVRAPHDVTAVAAVMPSIEDREVNADPATFLSTKARPVLEFANGTWFLGRWHLNDVEVEVAHIRSSRQEQDRLLETSGEAVWHRCESVEVLGMRIPIVPLEVQMATMLARGQHDRLSHVMQAGAASHLNGELLRAALHDQGFDDAGSLPPPLRVLLAH
jgi:hypothetical protein